MNDIPLLNLIPAKYQHYAAFLAVVIPMIGRAYHALASGNGLKGLWNGLVFGTNAPKDSLTSSEAANLRAVVIKDVPAGQPVPVPSAPPAVQKENAQPVIPNHPD